MKRILLVLLVTVALAGCSSDPSESADEPPAEAPNEVSEDTESTEPGPSNEPEPSEPGEPGEPAENRPPAGTLTASIQNGPAPVLVNFTIEGGDPDGDAVSWTLDFGDGSDTVGTQLPSNVEHTYASVGVYNATLTLSDGALEHAVSIQINATEAAQASPSFETIVISGSISGFYASDPFLGLGAGYLTDPNTHQFDVPGVAKAIHFLLEWDDFGYDLDFDIITPDGSEAASAANYNDPVIGDGAQFEEAEATDPAHLNQVGAWSADVYSAGSYESDYTLTITFTE